MEDRDYIYGIRFHDIEKDRSDTSVSLNYIIYQSQIVDSPTYSNDYTYDLWRYSGAFAGGNRPDVIQFPDEMSLQNSIDAAFLNLKGVTTFMPQIHVKVRVYLIFRIVLLLKKGPIFFCYVF